MSSSILLRDNEVHVLWSEEHTLLAKGAVEYSTLANSESSFYSRYFLVPKKDGGLKERSQTSESCPHSTAIQNVTLKHILTQIFPGTGLWI